jgi:uncharacterized lipoprotein YddW (UPF0748 family)
MAAVGLALLGAFGCTLATTPLTPPPPPADLPAPSLERVRPAVDDGARADADRTPVAPPAPAAVSTPAPPAVPVPVPGSAPAPAAAPAPSAAPIPAPAPAAVPARDSWTVPAATVVARPLPARLPSQVRALWVVRTALTHPDSVRAVVRRAEAGGFNTLLVQVRGRGDAWYRSSLEPRALQLAHLPPDYDPLALLLEEAAPRGIQVHAWINVHVVASTELPPVDRMHLMHADPEWLALPRALAGELARISPRDPRYLEALVRWTRANATQVEGLYTSPAHPAVRDRVVGVVQELVDRYPVDGIHLDYVRYPSPQFDYSPVALREFRLWLAGQAPDLSRLAAAEARVAHDPAALPDAFPELWNRFREDQVTELVTRIAGVVRSAPRETLLSAAVFSDVEDARRHRFQAWEQWVAEGWVDVIVPMVYTPEDAVFEARVRRAAQVAGPERVWAGVGLYRTSFPGSVTQGQSAFRERLGGVALFSYDWAVGPEGLAALSRSGGGGEFLERWGREVWADR